jgi:uncharacterized membrane protein
VTARALARALGGVTAAVALLCALPAAPAFARVVEEGGYKYVQIGLGGLWGGFFVFLLGIVVCLVGLFLVILWRRSARAAAAVSRAKGAEEEDSQVF